MLDYAVERAADLQIVRTVAVESEMALGFAAVHQLLVPFPHSVDRLPGPQRRALGVAFGLVSGPPADPFLVGLAVLTLLADAAEVRPVLCVIDDAQWLDDESADVLGFVARRLLADKVGMLFAIRETTEPDPHLQALPGLRLAGLPEPDAHELLATAGGRPRGRSGGAHRRRDRWQPPGHCRGHGRADPGATARTGTAARAAARRPRARRPVRAPRAETSHGHTDAAVAGGGGAAGPRRSAVARGRRAGHPGGRRGARGGRGNGGLLAGGAVLPPARPLGGLPRRGPGSAAGGPPGPRGGLRSAARSGSPGLAPGRGHRQARRRGRGSACGGSGPGQEPWWLRRRGCAPGARGVADPRRGAAGRAPTVGSTGPRGRGGGRPGRGPAGRGRHGSARSAVDRAGDRAEGKDPVPLRTGGRVRLRPGLCGTAIAAARPARREDALLSALEAAVFAGWAPSASSCTRTPERRGTSHPRAILRTRRPICCSRATPHG